MKKLSIIMVFLVLFSLMVIPVYADPLVDVSQNSIVIDEAYSNGIKLTDITLSYGEAILESVSPVTTKADVSNLPSFSSREEALAYIQREQENITLDVPSNNISLFSTNGNVQVAASNRGFWTLSLWLRYGTSLSGNRGTITYHNAYTASDGFTLGSRYAAATLGSNITGSGKNIYCYTSGTVHLSLLVDGLIEIYNYPISLDGTIWVIR